MTSNQGRPKVTEIRRMRRPVGVDLFAGVGGLSLGFEEAGFDVVAAVEYDPVHAAIHAYNFPLTAIVCADVSKLELSVLDDAIQTGLTAHGSLLLDGEIDVVFGGPPCQGFSTMGKRDISDKRNRLVYRFLDIVLHLRPRYFVMENVPGMAAGGHAGILERLVRRFEQNGYDITSVESVRNRILNAKDFGVPQDRRRLFLLGTRRGMPTVEYPKRSVQAASKRRSPLDAALPLDDLPPGPTVWDAIRDVPNLDAFEELWETDEVVLPTEVQRQMDAAASIYARRLRGLDQDRDDRSYPRQWNPGLLTASMRTRHTHGSVERFSATQEGQTEPISRFYRLDANGLCNTLRAGTGSERGAYTSPRPLHPYLPRVLSVREAARLHSFPDWFRFHRTKWHGFRSIGNAVPPLLGRAIGNQISAALRVQPVKPERALKMGDDALLAIDRLTAAKMFDANMSHIPRSRQRATDVSA